VGKTELTSTVTIAPTMESLLQKSELIILTTTAGTPHITNPKDLAHNPVVLHISLRDISPELILKSQNVVDDIEHVLNANTLTASGRPASPETTTSSTARSRSCVLGEVRLNRNSPIIFSPFGMGILDLALGKWGL